MNKLGVIHYNTPGKNLTEFLEWAANTGFGYVELMPPDVKIDGQSESSVLSEAHEVKKLVNSFGLRVSAFSARNDFLVTDPDAIKLQVERMKIVAKATRVLDEQAVVRSEGGAEKTDIARDDWGNVLYECFARCRDFFVEEKIDIAIDNHGTVTNEGDLLIDLIRRLETPSIGSNLDTMNFRWLGNSLETCDRFYKTLAPFVKHVHLKDGRGSRENYRGEALGAGEIHLSAALSSLRDAGYSGVYAAEYEGPETVDGIGYAKCLEWMKNTV